MSKRKESPNKSPATPAKEPRVNEKNTIEQAVLSRLSNIVHSLVELPPAVHGLPTTNTPSGLIASVVDRTEQHRQEDAANAMAAIMQRSPDEIVETFVDLEIMHALYLNRRRR